MSLIQIRKRSLTIETLYHEGGPVAEKPLKLAAACATGDTSDRIFARPAIRAEVVPDPELAAAYAKKYEAHHAAYPRLRDLTALGA